MTSRRAADDQYSLMHAKLFGGWNAIVTDPWDADVVYFIDAEAEAVHQVVDKTADGKRPEVAEVWATPEPSQTPGRWLQLLKRQALCALHSYFVRNFANSL